MQIVTRRLLATGVEVGTETGPHSITAQTGFELITLLSQPLQCWDYKHKHHTQPPKSSYSNDQLRDEEAGLWEFRHSNEQMATKVSQVPSSTVPSQLSLCSPWLAVTFGYLETRRKPYPRETWKLLWMMPSSPRHCVCTHRPFCERPSSPPCSVSRLMQWQFRSLCGHTS